jgi:ribonuclease P protein component
MSATLGKEYKLCSAERIAEIFRSKKSVKNFPLVAHYVYQKQQHEKVHFQIVLSAPKRTFRKAVERNRIKRLLRESVRHNKLILEEFLILQDAHLYLFLVYTGKEELTNSVLTKKMNTLFHTLTKKLSNEIL